MLDAQSLKVTSRSSVVINRVVIVWVGAISKGRRKLPNHVRSNARVLKDRGLPLGHVLLSQLRCRGRILLHYDGLLGRFANLVVLRYPRVAPGIVISPLVWVHVYGAKVQSWDGEVLNEVNAFVSTVGITTIASGIVRGKPTFVAEADHMVPVKAFDVLADCCGPISDDGGVAC